MKIKIHILLAVLLFFSASWANAQLRTKVSGIVTDAATNEALPFVNLIFVGKSVGTITDYNGKYEIISQWASDSIKVSFVGYEPQTIFVKTGETQKINFQLKSTSHDLETFEIVAKKTRYRNKDNISVE